MEKESKSDSNKKRANRKAVVDPTLGSTGIPVFSQQFLAYNKSRESALRKLRREIGELEDETEAAEKRLAAFRNEINAEQEQIFENENIAKYAASTVERWRKIVLAAFDNGKLLTPLHLTLQSTSEELISKLEEMSDISRKSSATGIALKNCLAAINFK